MATNHVLGMCRYMCPLSEITMRENNRLVHKFELEHESTRGNKRHEKADMNKMVKEYSRPAAGKEQTDPLILRPPRIILCTVTYLLSEVCMRDDCEWSEIYEFVFDRLRAVRQDMVIQGMENSPATVYVLQAAISFHLYSAYRLCTASPRDYDEKINSTHTNECLHRLIACYSDSLECRQIYTQQTNSHKEQNDKQQTNSYKQETNVHSYQDQSDNDFAGEFKKISLSQKSQKKGDSDKDDIEGKGKGPNLKERREEPGMDRRGAGDSSTPALICTCRQAEFMAVYLLFNLGEPSVLRLAFEWNKQLCKNYAFYLSLEISKAWMIKNFVRVLRLAEDLPPLLLCALHRNLQNIHRECLERMNSGYSSKNLTYPLRDLTSILRCDDDKETTILCQYYGISVLDSGKVQFLKSSFKKDEKLRPPKLYDWITSRLQEIPVSDLLLGESCTCLEQYTAAS